MRQVDLMCSPTRQTACRGSLQSLQIQVARRISTSTCRSTLPTSTRTSILITTPHFLDLTLMPIPSMSHSTICTLTISSSKSKSANYVAIFPSFEHVRVRSILPMLTSRNGRKNSVTHCRLNSLKQTSVSTLTYLVQDYL